MTIEDLEHIFRFQLHPAKAEEREENLYYMMIDGSDSKVINLSLIHISEPTRPY